MWCYKNKNLPGRLSVQTTWGLPECCHSEKISFYNTQKFSFPSKYEISSKLSAVSDIPFLISNLCLRNIHLHWIQQWKLSSLQYNEICRKYRELQQQHVVHYIYFNNTNLQYCNRFQEKLIIINKYVNFSLFNSSNIKALWM